jgi:hypothetical protein
MLRRLRTLAEADDVIRLWDEAERVYDTSALLDVWQRWLARTSAVSGAYASAAAHLSRCRGFDSAGYVATRAERLRLGCSSEGSS